MISKKICQFVIKIVAFMAIFGAFSACSSNSKSQPDLSPQKKLLASDIADFNSYQSGGAQSIDENENGVFTQIFGGTSGSNLTNYLNTRVHYYADQDEQISVSPGDFSVEGWTQAIFLGRGDNDSGEDVTVSAQNISIEYWMLGVLNNVDVTFHFQDQDVPINSARTGVVVLASGYEDTIKVSDGSTETSISLPAYYRQSILLHEARHSDCTGGLTSSELGRISQDKTAAQFSANQDAGFCGHLHIQCPSGDYKGLFACDGEPFGAYGVQSVFLRAAQAELAIEGQDQSLVTIMENDTYSRLLDTNPDVSNMAPDMSSDDQIRR